MLTDVSRGETWQNAPAATAARPGKLTRFATASLAKPPSSMAAASPTPDELFELRSAALTLIAVVLKTADLDRLAAELDRRSADNPGLFDGDPVAIDLAALAAADAAIDFEALVALLRRHRMTPIAVKGGSPAQMAAALAAGLVDAPDGMPQRPSPRAARPAAPTPAPEVQVQIREVQVEVPVEVPIVVNGPGTMVVTKPLRSGQQVYARGADLVVLAAVSVGAEVLADGHIHVYGPLRGRALAGARGNTEARIFTTCMEPQLVSIAGIYRTTEVPLPPEVLGKPAQVRLEGEKLVIEPLAP